MKNLKRFAAFVIAILMIATLIPASSFAAAKKTVKPVKKYGVTVQFRYSNGKSAAKAYKKTFKAGTTTKTVKVAVPQKKGYTPMLTTRTGAAAGSNVSVKLNAKKTRLYYKVKKIKSNVAFKIVYNKNADVPTEPVEPEEPAVYEAGDTGLGVSVTAQKNTFSEPVDLVVDSLAEDSEAYVKAEEELAKIGQKYEGMVAFDIHFASQETGEEVEPNEAVDVQLQILDAVKAGIPEEVLGNVTITHILDEGGAEIVSEPQRAEKPEDPTVEEFKTEVFSTYTISWYYGYYNYNIHYVDTEGNSLTPTRTPTYGDDDYMYLIYDIPGYEYDSTHYGSRNGASMRPYVLTYSGDRFVYYSRDLHYLRDDIYVVYKAKTTPTTGGTVPPPVGETWPEGDNAPQFSKSSTKNGDGTNTIALSIAAAEKKIENKTKANVIVVFDSSGSMNDDMNGNSTNNSNRRRITIAKNALRKMAETLEGKIDSQGNKLVNLALVDFDTTASRKGTWTDTASTFMGNTYLGGVSGGGGTNWEHALSVANRIENKDSDAATFILFVTDGNPTFRVSRGDVADSTLNGNNMMSNGTYASDHLFGDGFHDPEPHLNYNMALEEVKSILSKNKNFYAIGVSNDVSNLRNLVTDAGLSSDHAIVATNEDEMNAAFEKMAQSISASLGFGDVAITDGITALSNTEMKVMENVDPDSFQYYRWGGEGNKYGADEAHKKEWTTREEDGCAAATYNKSEGAVHWDMGEGFQLEDGVHYVVTFRVWASQEAYDLVAELNNGTKTFDSLSDAEKAQIHPDPNNPSKYVLKTNTDKVNATYSQTTKTGDTVTVTGEQDVEAQYHEGTIQDMPVDSVKLTIKKQFEDDLTAGSDRETQVVLHLLRRNARQTPEEEFEPYAVPQGGQLNPNIILNESNNWTYEVYVAPGVMTKHDGVEEVLENGYEFTIAEPNIDYHYDLIEERINPMVVNGEAKFLGDGFLIDDQQEHSVYIDQSLTAVNRVKAGIDVKKVVVDNQDQAIFPEKKFTFKGKILDPDGNGYEFNTAWDNREDKSTSAGASAEWNEHQNDPIAYHKYVIDPSVTVNVDGAIEVDGVKYRRTVYKGHFADTSDFEFTLKANEYIRFINVPNGSTFEFDEVKPAQTDDYEWIQSKGVAQHKTQSGGSFTPEGDVQPVVDGSKVKLDSGVVGNRQYSATFTNKAVKGEKFYVYHSSDNTIEKIYMTDSRVKEDGTFDIAAETKTGSLYGGYYKAYAGAKATDDQIIEVAESGNITYDTDGKGDDVSGKKPYTVDNISSVKWANTDAYTTDPGTAMHPEGDHVYYLKEVPDTYLRPAQMTTYQRFDGYLRDFILLSATDDRNYQTMGFKVGGTEYDKKTAPAGEFFFTDALEISFGPNYDSSVIDGKVTLEVADVNKSLKNGLVFSYRLFSVNEANPDYKDIEGTKLIKPYWVTPDSIKVVGAAMRRQVVADKNDSGKIEVIGTDADKQEIVWTDYKIKSIISIASGN